MPLCVSKAELNVHCSLKKQGNTPCTLVDHRGLAQAVASGLSAQV
jgi:hypothetical protein